MKLNKIFFALAVVAAFASCTKIDEIVPEGGSMLASQVQSTNAAIPTRASASFNGMFTNLGKPCTMYNTPDDWEFLMILFCNDLEGADAVIADSGYNWFSVCGEYSSRNNTYRNPAIRYRAPYNMIGDVNTFVSGFADDVDDPTLINMIAQARVLRAYSYMMLAPQYQFSPLTQTAEGLASNLPCVPLVTPETVDFTNNPRATVAEVYAYIMQDLDYAVEKLEGGPARTSKMFIDANVAYGLRARANLQLGNWDAAYEDAVKAADGYTPASMEDISKPAFMDIDEANWIWGYDMADGLPNYIANNVRGNGLYATTSSWLRSFSNNGYAPACQVYTCINKLLWDKIPATDVRKGWWVDENLESPLLKGLKWPGFDDVANADDGNNKMAFLPYTNVKFGCDPIATDVNEEDMPLMRVEEMILIQAEAKAHSDIAAATTILENFVKTYRNPSYSATAAGRKILDEIWFQRRVELWGEGFGVFDNLRLNKPIVRSHGAASSNIADNFRFNLDAQDPWLRMRFPQGEMNTNFGIVDNKGGQQPTIDMNPGLRDGVTD
ncbi:MAG: RagB/SusD family nutrient uptake outer membrane protein [Bacteroidales bacterium]|nr:RagB/SusD family nutrient uptake outer membrane protein [Bacteroidales bacterium]